MSLFHAGPQPIPSSTIDASATPTVLSPIQETAFTPSEIKPKALSLSSPNRLELKSVLAVITVLGCMMIVGYVIAQIFS